MGKGCCSTGTMPKMVFRGNFDRVSFALKLARKDLGLATEVGRELNVPMPIASLVEQDFLVSSRQRAGRKGLDRRGDDSGRPRAREDPHFKAELGCHSSSVSVVNRRRRLSLRRCANSRRRRELLEYLIDVGLHEFHVGH